MINVFICSTVVGGHEKQIKNFLKSRGLLNNEYTLFVPKNAKDVYDYLTGLDLPVKYVGFKLLKGNVLVQVLHALLLRVSWGWFRPDIVCAGAIELVVFEKVRSGRLGEVYIPSINERINWGALGSFYVKVLSSIIGCIDTVHTISDYQASLIGERLSGKINVIKNEITPWKVANKRQSPRLVFVGRLDFNKRIIELLDHFKNATFFTSFLVIGDGPLYSQCLEISKTAIIEIDLMGSLTHEEIGEVLCCTDVLVLNSIYEGEPLVVREALESGLEVLVRDIGSIRGITTEKQRFGSLIELEDRFRKICARYE